MSEDRKPLAACWRSRVVAAAVAALLAGVLLADAAVAQTSSDSAPDPDRSRAEYESVTREFTLSQERLAKLAADIATVKKDHASITAALIQSAKTEQKLGQDIEDIGARLEGLKGQEATVRASLAKHRDVLAEVLGALQRMGLNPPPAILVKPEDALSSVRSAILLGAVVPEMRAETDILAANLKELSRITTSIEAERGRLKEKVADQVAEKQRLTLLLQAKRKLQADTEQALTQEKENAQALAAKAKSLKDLIASLEKDADEKREAGKAQANEAELAALPVPEANQLAAATPFSALKGQIALPVIGKVKRRFGSGDGNGSTLMGDMVATQSGSIVTAPADGKVLYAGPFRSYGQLLILDAGDGYHVVLAGMTGLNVASGQSVLAGEPIGAMGEARVASASASVDENNVPELYVEFRKDGKPVDPAPWWADRFSGRT
ncbi:MAG: murein hydrolase activator EnvC [Mesorhizobium sp.]|jgi:septal ring factor EnvC (AmiA/AmiB activator)